jgi:hypothetical protein
MLQDYMTHHPKTQTSAMFFLTSQVIQRGKRSKKFVFSSHHENVWKNGGNAKRKVVNFRFALFLEEPPVPTRQSLDVPMKVADPYPFWESNPVV